jgi:hypothetical protein
MYDFSNKESIEIKKAPKKGLLRRKRDLSAAKVINKINTSQSILFK